MDRCELVPDSTMSSETTNAAATVYQETTERLWILQLITEVRDDGLYIRFKPIHWSFRRIPVKDIENVTVTAYSAADYGGWHWGVRKSLSGNTVYRLRGDRGVEVTLQSGKQIFIGSRSPSELETAVQRVTGAG